MPMRQQILYLWLAEGALDTETVGWAFHDGTSGAGPQLPEPEPESGSGSGSGSEPPYPTGLAALEQGWFLIQSPAPYSLHPGAEYEVSYLANEFIFERRIEV